MLSWASTRASSVWLRNSSLTRAGCPMRTTRCPQSARRSSRLSTAVLLGAQASTFSPRRTAWRMNCHDRRGLAGSRRAMNDRDVVRRKAQIRSRARCDGLRPSASAMGRAGQTVAAGVPHRRDRDRQARSAAAPPVVRGPWRSLAARPARDCATLRRSTGPGRNACPRSNGRRQPGST